MGPSAVILNRVHLTTALAVLAAVGATSCETTRTPEALSLAALEQAEYRFQWIHAGRVKLLDGQYSEPAAPGSAMRTTVKLTDVIARGRLDGQSAAAVVLVTDTGGSGTFFELAVMLERKGAPVNVASAHLGDRVKVTRIALRDNRVYVDLVAHGPQDPMCCPTRRAARKFALHGDRLSENPAD